MKKYLTLAFLLHLLLLQAVFGQKTIRLVEGSTEKIEQVIGDWDKEAEMPTRNRTFERFLLPSTDLGVPFQHKDKTYICFGDVWLDNGDPLGFTVDTVAANGISIDFVSNTDGSYREVLVPGVSMEGFEVPMEGVSWNGNMYLYCTTDVMKKSILARSTNDGLTFTKLYDVSTSRFINLNLVKAVSDENYPVAVGSGIQIMFGSGEYRKSSVYLAFQRGDQIDQRSIQYFSALDDSGTPEWSSDESAALPLFDQPCVGELSVSYNAFIAQWILTYNCGEPRGINCRVADHPWGPWSEPFLIFRPWEDNGYCHFMHTSWDHDKCDDVHDDGRENEWGGEYGPYQFDQLATGGNGETTIYYTLSTWNPYTVVLMKSTLRDMHVSNPDADLQKLDKLQVYPNPCQDFLMLSFDSGMNGSYHIQLHTITGKVALSAGGRQPGEGHTCRLDTSSLPPGIYFLHVETAGGEAVYTSKIMIAGS